MITLIGQRGSIRRTSGDFRVQCWGQQRVRVTKYGHFCRGGSDGNKSQLVGVHTRGSTEEAAADGTRSGGGISASVRSWLSALAAMVTESADIHGMRFCALI